MGLETQTALHPDILERLRTEQQNFRDQPITLELLRQMPYLEQVMREVLRFTPPVGGVFRKILKTCEYNGYRLPQGWAIAPTPRDGLKVQFRGQQ